MATHDLALDDLTGWIVGATSPRIAGKHVVVVDLDDHLAWDAPPIPEDLPNVVVGTTREPDPEQHPAALSCDAVVAPADGKLDAIVGTVARNPKASVALVRLLRGSAARSLAEGLEAESLAYSELQGGPELRRWLAHHERKDRGPEGDAVRIEREGDVLRLTLQRPHVRNALNAAMREGLLDGLLVAELDPSIRRIDLCGDGPAFCAGGDLDEFGTFESPEAAHVLRLERSVGRAIAQQASRVVAHLHGRCAGSGIELPAFAGHLIAHPDTTFSLPELALGLVPGAGGTVSLPARIGRHRTALLALTAWPIDTTVALDWGLVDELA